MAQQAVKTRLSGDPARPIEFVARVVQYSFIELAQHRARLRSRVSAIPEVVSLSVDETKNRIEIGLADPAERENILDLASDLAIPVDMLYLRTAPSLKIWSVTDSPGLADGSDLQASTGGVLTLKSPVPDGKLVGGYQVGAEREGEHSNCSIGFTALREDFGSFMDDYEFFVSASHCSTEINHQDDGLWRQPRLGDVVGREFVDRPMGYGCDFKDNKCRVADASLVKVTGFGEIALGLIARTKVRADPGFYAPNNPTNEVDTIRPTIRITGVTNAVTGEEIDKVGYAGGWTWGVVQDNCTDKRKLSDKDGKYTWYNCLIRSNYKAKGNDSGGPVFKYDKVNGTALLIGIHIGSSATADQYTGNRYASRFSSIEHDLGDLFVRYRSPPPPPDTFELMGIEGPRVVAPDTECSWTAATVGGGGLEYAWSGILTGDSVTVTGIVAAEGHLKVLVTGSGVPSGGARDSIWVDIDDDTGGFSGCGPSDPV